MPSLGDFFYTQFLLRIPKPTASFASKTVVITGANSGLGKETAKHIVRLGASKVILACRSQSRGDAAKAEIESLFPRCTPGTIEAWPLDLESASSIAAFAQRAAKNLPRLDVVINNAGIHGMGSKFKLVYGTEHTLAVNVVGTFLLAIQLLPILRSTARKHGVDTHMTTVTSALYDAAKYPSPPMPLDKNGEDIFMWFAQEDRVNQMNQYNLSKLLQIYVLIRLSAQEQQAGSDTQGAEGRVVINSLDPCFCKTGLGRGLSGPLRVLRVFEAIAARPAEEGSRLVVQAASAGPETHGLYMRAGKVRAYEPVALDEAKGAHVWEALSRRLEALSPGVLSNLAG
ncbi:Ketoreductase (KR) domain-containing protein [Madurella fahalii]|uniref:Ketoreductase (KR) domain-containing protein n=1 Tax=Madurella fahalii TaxID=1157608 RepID=A0ABQ0GNQ4_9PEZI